MRTAPPENQPVCLKCYRRSSDLDTAEKELEKKKAALFKDSPTPASVEDTILANLKDLYNSLDQFSPMRPELRFFLGKTLSKEEICKWFSVSERTEARSRELR